MRNEKESHVRENSVYMLAQKKEKNDSLEGGVRKKAETEGKDCWKKKKEQDDVGHHTTQRCAPTTARGRVRCAVAISTVWHTILIVPK